MPFDIESFDARVPLLFIFTGRGGIGGGVEAVLSVIILEPLVYQ